VSGRDALAPSAPESEIDLLGSCETVINFDPEIANAAFKLGMTCIKYDSRHDSS
jgi:hypothetical protein